MPKKTPPFGHYPAWTTAKFFSFIRSGLRAKWTRWPPKYAVMAAAKRVYTGDNKRQKFEYLCSECNEYHPQKETEVDHCVPCGSLRSYEDIGSFVERLFVGEDKLRLVCKTCHREITKKERERKKNE